MIIETNGNLKCLDDYSIQLVRKYQRRYTVPPKIGAKCKYTLSQNKNLGISEVGI